MRFVRVLVSGVFLIVLCFSVYVKVSDSRDFSAPTLSCDTEKIVLSVEDGDDVLLKHVTATDEKDGDITPAVIVENISSFITPGMAKVIFSVCDSDNNVSKLEADVEYSDYKAPEFAVSRAFTYYVGAIQANLLEGVSVGDVLEGNVTSRAVILDSSLNLSAAGTYPVTFRVTTEKGVSSLLTMNVRVYETRLLTTISLKQYLYYTDVNKKPDPNSFISSYPTEMLEDGYSSEYDYQLQITDGVDYTKPGTYEIAYRLIGTPASSRVEGEPITAAEAFLTVIVRGEG